jgi:hypothetical protein
MKHEVIINDFYKSFLVIESINQSIKEKEKKEKKSKTNKQNHN